MVITAVPPFLIEWTLRNYQDLESAPAPNLQDFFLNLKSIKNLANTLMNVFSIHFSKPKFVDFVQGK